MRRFEFVGGGSAKFWEVSQAGALVTVRFGRLEGLGQKQTKDLGSESRARSHVAKLVEEKLGNGYVEVPIAAASPPDSPVSSGASMDEEAASVDRASDSYPSSLAAQLRAAAPTVGPHLARGLRPAVRLASRRAADSEIAIGSTKFGGNPDLPAGTTWPVWSGPPDASAPRRGMFGFLNRASSDKPLRFFAQVNLADAAAAAPADLSLPSSGLLSFFADFGEEDGGIVGLFADEQEGCRVLFTPPAIALERRRPPVAAFQSGSLTPVAAWTWPTDAPPEVRLPNEEVEALISLDQDYERSLRTDLPPGRSMSGRHQVGGHARYIQHPVEEEVVQALGGCYTRAGGFDRERWDEVKDQVADWRVLLQIDSDDTLGVMWGDVGTLYWAARSADVQAGVWSRAMFNFQSS